MMSPIALAPLAVAVVLVLVVTTVHRRLPPVRAARMLAATLAVTVAAAAPTLWLVSLGFLAHTPLIGGGLRWCASVFEPHQRVPTALGLPVVAISAVGLIRSWRVVRTHRRLRHDDPGAVTVLPAAEVFAYALPGAGGRIVVSRALVELLDDEEQAIVVAHERAHTDNRHDRYLLLGQLADAFLPPLRPLTRRLRFSLERWADDAAASSCGDRAQVARTLAKVALRGAGATPALGFVGLGVGARVEVLLSDPLPAPRRALLVSLWVSIIAAAALAVVQLHDLTGLIAALCPG